MPPLPDDIRHALDALSEDERVDRGSVAAKVRQIQSRMRTGTPGAIRKARDLGAELRVAVEILRHAPKVERLTFPATDPPDLLVRFLGEDIPVEVTRLSESERGPEDSDVEFLQAEDFNSKLLGRSSEPEAGLYVRDQVAKKLAKGAPVRGAVLVIATDSPTNKWTAVACSGAWLAAARASLSGETIPFGEIVVWYSGRRFVEMPRRILTNASLRTGASTALIEKAFRGIREFEAAGPGDPRWVPDTARQVLDRGATNG
jgi:hypothetical protein